ncbi:hypothetical protein DSL92_07735 [Billgrantia gudaonensis]|uniref:Uncharacterized protein n=1 Tax=Billgrantia gudaonensis TaxID=376427 RepID=A0A432JGM0_9GAMM|nr:hypothetical protein DSL92_07735 [Halomonas gudaonensis]
MRNGRADRLAALPSHRADEWSVNLMMEELEQAYRDRVAGNQPTAAPALPFHEFALRQHAAGEPGTSRLLDGEVAAPGPAAAGGLGSYGAGGRTGVQRGAGWNSRWNATPLASTGCQAQRRLAVQRGLCGDCRFDPTPGGLDEIVIGTSASGRTDADFFDTIGYFTTVVAHRIGFPDTMTLAGLIEQVKYTINESMPVPTFPSTWSRRRWLPGRSADGIACSRLHPAACEEQV